MTSPPTWRLACPLSKLAEGLLLAPSRASHASSSRPTLPDPGRRARIARQVLCILIVGVTLYLTGCATYETTRPASLTGTVTVSWIFEQTFSDDRCGETIQVAPTVFIIRMKGKPPTFNDRLECAGHELLHTMGGSHE